MGLCRLFFLSLLAAAGVLVCSLGRFASLATGSEAGAAPPSFAAGLGRIGPLGDQTMGEPGAPITVVEYASLTCSHCAAFHLSDFATMERDYIKKGRVRFIYRDFPLDPLALKASTYARCMPPGSFFPYIKHLFSSQAQWVDPSNVGGSFSTLKVLTQQAGLGADQIALCEKNRAVRSHLEFVYNNGKDRLRVGGAPSFFVNGEPVQAHEVLNRIKRLSARFEEKVSAH